MTTEKRDDAAGRSGSALERGVVPLAPKRDALDDPAWLRRLCEDGLTWHSEGMPEHSVCLALLQALDELDAARERAEFLLAMTRDAQDHAAVYGFKVNTYAEALRRVKCEAVSLADAQVLALEALRHNAGLGPLPEPAHFARVGDCEYRDCWNAQQVRAYALAEVSRAVAPLLAALQGLLSAVQRSVCEGSGPAQEAAHAAINRALGRAA